MEDSQNELPHIQMAMFLDPNETFKSRNSDPSAGGGNVKMKDFVFWFENLLVMTPFVQDACRDSHKRLAFDWIDIYGECRCHLEPRCMNMIWNY